ncbi:hypothetical protein GCM10010259_07800 [Streptomyces daghestanicus]|uniref:Uncharacterized protein n=3 Tax=Streptomyces TaxID=1883 RepID=A0A918LC25_STRGD|nr:hypothetical protein GCM10010238_16810 [Streptomyces niveoruber]GGS80658.1 hypothetical protein GCM10010240_12440 [Streptomyces griseoviridis]GGU19756.1 hypothetical protein GCM10010259_07800 [Streptomyces daghestanicus]GHI32152.1 hypothetical protein Sdagh_38820 [Streptomyces daghestanicus]
MVPTPGGAFFINGIGPSGPGQPRGVLNPNEREYPMRAVRRLAAVLTTTAALLGALTAEAAAIGIDLGGGLTL